MGDLKSKVRWQMETIKKDIQNKEFKRVYLLYGETYLKRQFSQLLRDAVVDKEDSVNYHYFEGEAVSFSQVIDTAETIPFLSEYKVILIENSGACNKSSDQIADYIPTIPESTILIFLEEHIRKNTRLYKAIDNHGHCAWFQKQSKAVLIGWIRKKLKEHGKTITEDAIRVFLEKTCDIGTDQKRKKETRSTELEYMNMELEKVISYAYYRDEITAEDIETIVHVKLQNRIFNMLTAIFNKNTKEALSLYYELLSLGEKPFLILLSLTKRFNEIYQVKLLKESNYDDEQISKKIGIESFNVRKYAQQARRLGNQVLREALEECIEMRVNIVSGIIDDTVAVELLIVKYSSK